MEHRWNDTNAAYSLNVVLSERISGWSLVTIKKKAKLFWKSWNFG